MQFEWSLVPWASGVVKHLATPEQWSQLGFLNSEVKFFFFSVRLASYHIILKLNNIQMGIHQVIF